MALPPTEIRYRKYVFYPFLAMNAFMIVMMTWSLFILTPVWSLYLTYILVLLIIAFSTLWIIQKIRANAPVMTFESHALTIHKRKVKTILWPTIIEWKVRRDKSSEYLVIRTSTGKVRVAISWLDMPVKEIKRLMESYIRQPGPHGGLR
ncbi:MAG: hypothetical protein JST68_21945 [Bacteroidetes bacterium]|nr:hypothetical protein [Bacteroidota bacterium]